MNRSRSRPHRGRRGPGQNTEGATFLDIAEIKSKTTPELHEMADQLARIHPSECLVNEDEPPLPESIVREAVISKRPPPR